MNSFHERLNRLKDDCGATQAKIAEAIEITPQALSYYLKGREPNYDLLIKLAKYFDCTVDYLLGLSNHKNIKEKEAADEFINLLKETLSSLDEELLDVTKKGIQNIFKISKRKDITPLMAYSVMSSMYLIASVINEIMDTMSRARALSLCDVIEKEDFSRIMWAIRKVNRLELYIQQDVEQILEKIVTVPSIKIKKALNNANYNVDFMDLLIDSFIVELGDIDNKLLLKEIDYIAPQE